MRISLVVVAVMACGDNTIPEPVDLTLQVTPKRLVANGRVRAIVKAQLRDLDGNPLPDREVTFASDGPATFAPAVGITDADGRLSTDLTGVDAGERTISATTGVTVATVNLTLTSPCAAPLLPGFPAVPVIGAIAGDFNEDGVQDLVGLGLMQLDFASGNSDGSFQPTEPITTTFTSFVVADFNGDGHLDIGGASNRSNMAGVLLGRGDGTFDAELAVPIGLPGYGAVAGDFDGDGRLDLAVYAVPSDTTPIISTLYGNGDGTFSTPVDFVTTAPNNSLLTLLAVDLDGDQVDDLVTYDLFTPTLSILGGAPNRVFAVAPDVVLGVVPDGAGTANPGVGGVVAADLDGNGVVDLAVARYFPSATTVLLGNGDSTFQTPRQFAGGLQGRSIVALDIDSDDHVDIVSADGFSIHVARGIGDGTLAAPTAIATPGAGTLAIGDLDGDGLQDLVLGGSPSDSFGTTIAFGNGTGFTTLQSPIPPVSSAAVGDFNKDGHPDLVTTPPRRGVSDDDKIEIRLGNGDGTFADPVTVALVATPSAIVVADVDGDTFDDIAVAGATEIRIMRNDRAGGLVFTSVALQSSPFHRGLVVADFNGDGDVDLAISRDFQGPIGTPTLGIALGNGDGSFGALVEQPAPTFTRQVVAGDFNGDGKLDLVTGSAVSQLFVGNGNGTFTASTMFPDGGVILDGGIVAVDLDRDGFLDLLMTGQSLQVHRGQGNGAFHPPVTIAPQLAGNPELVVDLDGNGTLDIVGSGLQGLTVTLGRPDGTFEPPLVYPTISASRFMFAVERTVAADFDSDGLIDLATSGGVLLHSACP